jgi:sugar O-acyltransferase (sialic acid O-acetyltransferase NeuD family)
MIKKIAIIGAGGFGREVKWLIDSINLQKKQWDFIGYYDDDLSERKNIEQKLLLGGIGELNKVDESLAVVIANGNPKTKRKIVEQINNSNLYFPSLVHPNCLIGNNVAIGQGTVICANNILTCDIMIEDFVTLNLACTVGHDTIIKSYCSIMPTVNVSGEVFMEECVYVGTGAKIINQINIGSHSIIGAGAVVIKDVPQNSTAVGVPAKYILKNG